MTNAEIIQAIRVEIERLLNEAPTWDDTIAYLTKVECFLDTLESEKPVPNDLEEAANKFAVFYDQGTCDGIAQDCFRAGAEWQKEQYHFFNKAWAENMQAELDRNYENGKQAMKEQMMKEAVEGKIIFLLNGDVAVNIGDTDEYKLGQKVRIIIVKD